MAQDLFGYIKQKAQDASSAVAPIITQSPFGFVQKTLQDFGQSHPDQAQTIIDRGQPVQDRLFSAFKSATPAIPYYQNRVVKPVQQAAQDFQTAADPGKAILDRVLAGIKGGLGVGGVAMSVNPINPTNLAFLGYDALKAAGAQGQQPGTNPAEQLRATLEGALGERSTGLGDALTSNPTGRMVGNTAELPLMLAAGLIHGKSGGAKTIDEILNTAKRDANGNIIDRSVVKALDMLPKSGERSFFSAFKGNAPEEVIRGTNKPQETTLQYLRPKGSSPINFVAGEKGVSKVKIMSESATKALEDAARANAEPPVGVAGALPSPGVNGLLPKPGETVRPNNPVSRELLSAQKTIQDTADSLKRAVLPKVKGAFEKASNYLFGDKSLQGARGVVASDSPAGKFIVDTMNSAEGKVADLAGRDNATLQQALGKLKGEELTTFADVVEGKAKSISQAQAEAAATWRQIAQNIHELAVETGMKVGKITDYFPHFFNQDGKLALDETSFIDRGANMDYGNLTKARKTDSTDFIKDPNVLFDYVQHAYDNIVKRAYFGEGDKTLYGAAGKTSNPSQVRSILDTILGKGQQGGLGETISQGIRSVETTKMGFLSPLTNLTQQLSAVARTDVPTAIKTYTKMIQNPEQTVLNAIKAGEIEPGIGDKLLQRMTQLRDASIGTKWLELIRFNQAEKMNRVFATNAGIEFATKLIDQAKGGSEAAVRELNRLGITDLAKVTEQDLIRAGRKVSQETQFATSKGGLPQGWETPVGKVATQFKSFAYKQTGFVRDQAVRVASEASKGNLEPLKSALVAYGVGAPLVGEVINDVRSLITNKKRDSKNIVDRYIQDVFAGSSLGLLDNLPGLTGQYGEAGVISSAFGPFAGDVVKAGTAMADTAKGVGNYDPTKSVLDNLDPNRTTRRFILGSVPGVGKTISNTTVPNSYVENYVGPNVGLNQKDTQTYRNIQANDQSAAEQFKAQQQKARDTAPSFWDKLTGKQAPLTVPGTNATSKEKKNFDTQVNNMLESGAVPSTEQLSYTVFRGKKATSPILEERNSVYKSIKSVMGSDKYTEEQKAAIVEASGAKQANVDYYMEASKDTDVKIQELLPKLDNMGDQQLLTFLASGRRAVGGAQLITSSVITYLYDNNIIGKNERDMLSALKFDEGNGKFYFSRGFTSGGAPKKISYAQAKKLFGSVKLPTFSEMQKIIGGSGQQTVSSGATLISEILSRKPKKITVK